MTPSWPDIILVILLLTGTLILVTKRAAQQIYLLSIQGVLIGILITFISKDGFESGIICISIGALLIKGFFVPRLLMQSVESGDSPKSKMAWPSFAKWVCASGFSFGLLIWLDSFHLLTRSMTPTFGAIISAFLLLAGLLVIGKKHQPLCQLVGVSMLENGFFLIGVSFPSVLPLVLIPLLGEVPIVQFFLSGSPELKSK